MALNQINPLSF